MAKYGNHGPKTEKSSITWTDAHHLLVQMQQHLGMHVRVVMTTEVPESLSDHLMVWVEAYEWDKWLTGKPTHRVKSYWPQQMSKTVPGLVVRLLHQLDHMAWSQAQLPEGEGDNPA